MTKNLIELKNISKTFLSGERRINLFDNVNLKIKKGDLIALVGPSGSGKSTFLHMLALLEEPNKGKIYLSDIDTGDMTESEKDNVRREKISIIFQNNNLLNDFTALENVLMPLYIKGNINQNTREKGLKILTDVKLNNRANHFPSELSGGESQRVAISRALINSPDIVLADEPTGNLDHKNARDIFRLLFSLKNKKRIIIFATHNRHFADMSDCKLSLINGNISTVNARN